MEGSAIIRPSMLQIGALEEVADAVEGVFLDIRAGKRPSECLRSIFHMREMYRRFCSINHGVNYERWTLVTANVIGLVTYAELLHDRYVLERLGSMRIDRI